MSEYYTPTIDEFHVGFEYERLEPDYSKYNGGFWEKKILTLEELLDEELDTLTHDIKYQEVRVKYLDQEDIESLGFELVGNPGGLVSYVKYCKNTTWHITVARKLISLSGTRNLSGSFVGYLKNKSELSRIIKLLTNEG